MPQSLARILVHIIFSTKNRKPLIEPAVEPELHRYLASICRAHQSPALTVGGADDHVHVCCSLSKNLAVAELLEQLKTESSKWMKRKGCPSFYWQTGYGAFSIGESGVAAVRRYIARQKAHHRKVPFKEEFRAFLKRYGVEYDERYVWD